MEYNYKKFDIVLVDFGENTLDSEQSGIRPAIIIQNDVGNYFGKTTIVLPISSKIKNLNQPTHALIKRGRDNRLDYDSMILGECIRQISEKRIVKHIGTILNEKDKNEIRKVYLANFGE